MKKRRILSLFLTAALAASAITGCSGSSSTNTASTAGSTAATDNGDKVTLSMMVTTRPSGKKDFYLDYLPQLVKEKYPNINVEVEQLPTDQYKQTIRLKFSSGQGPDMFNWWPNLQAKDLVDANYVKDLSDYPQLSKYNKEIVKSYTFNGKTYAIPNGTSFLTTWYNKNAFKKAGVTKLPTNWDEFLGVCEKLKAAGITPITCGDKQSFVIQFCIYQIAASEVYGSNMNFDTDLTSGKTKFTDQCWVNALSKMQTLYKKGYVIKNSLGLSQDQSRQAFIDGDAAMIFDGSFGYDALTKKGKVDFERGMFCVPGNDSGKKFIYNLTPSTGLFVSANSKKQDAIKKVMDLWLTPGTKLNDAWKTMNWDVPCYQGFTDSRDLIKNYLDQYKNDASIYNCNNAWPEGVSDAMCSKFQEAITGSATAQDVAKTMQDKFDELNKN